MSLAHRRAGRGEPLLLVHGTGSQWQMWAPVLDRLARERDVVAVDLPGFGDSPPLADGRAPTPAALADAVADWARDALGWESAHVAGNSLGGGIALELARSGFARSACGLSPIGFWTAAEVAYARRSLALSRAVSLRLAPHAERAFGSPAGRVALLGQLTGRPWRVPPADAARSIRNLAASPGFDATVDSWISYRWEGPEPAVPVTIAWGARDALLFPWQGRRARRALPGARHVTLAGCGHVPTWDDPRLVAWTLLEASA